LLFLIAGLGTYAALIRVADARFLKLRESEDTLFKHLRALLYGIKELKMHGPRRCDYLDRCLGPTLSQIRQQSLRAGAVYAAAGNWGSLLFFACLGLFLFMPGLRGSAHVTGAFLIVIIYLMGPVEAIIGLVLNVHQGTLALGRIEAVAASLPEEDLRRPDSTMNGASFSELRLEGITHHFYSEKEGSTFALGPIDDFYLFEQLLGSDGKRVDAQAIGYLREMDLQHKCKVEEGALSTIDLSQGQRKRLALLSALLEDRPFYLFDEWAADQDPSYKKVFYTKILPDLRRKGKTVVAITHDDAYFHLADRLIRVEAGKIVHDLTDPCPMSEGRPNEEAIDRPRTTPWPDRQPAPVIPIS
jgi:putative pyoverdin transport system ATP-binding/permease protein